MNGLEDNPADDEQPTEAEWDLYEMRQAALTYRELCTCYRLGKSPSEALHKRLVKASALLDSKGEKT